MAEYVVELPELEVACDFFIESEYPYFEELREAFLILKLCGCRPMEIFEISRWSYVDGWSFTLQPQKNNLTRSVVLGEGCESFRTCVINQTAPFMGRTYSQIQGLFYKLCPWRPIFSGEREITLYVYRYFFVKSLIASGLTYSQVAELMGHRTETPVYLYANAILTSTYVIPVTPSDPYPENHIDILLQSTVFDGIDDYLTQPRPWVSPYITYYFRGVPNATTAKYIIGGDYSQTNGLSFEMHAKNLTSSVTFQLTVYYQYTSSYGSLSFSFPNATIYDVIFMLDFSELGSSGGDYRNIKLYYYTKSGLSGGNTLSNKNLGFSYIQNIMIGCRRSANGTNVSFFNGTIDKVILWNRLLNSDERTTLFNL